MLLVGKDLASYTLAAGEPFVLEVQLLDSAGRATDLDDQAMVLTFYTAGTRALVTDYAGAPSQYEGERLSDTTGEYFRWAFDGRWSEAMLSKPGLRVELAQRLFYGRSIISTGTLSVINSSAVVPSLAGGSIALTAVRVSIKANATLGGAPQITQTVILYDGPSVPIPAPVFTTPTSVASDGTPQVGELLTGIDGVATNAASYTRRWLLGSTLLTSSATYTPTAAGSYRYETIATGPGGETTSGSNITVAAAPLVLNALTISPSTATAGTSTTITISGATAGSVITGTVPAGMTLNSAARTITGTPTTAGSPSIVLTETLAGATGSPRQSTVGVTIAAAPVTPSLGALTVSPSSATVGTAYSGTINGLSSGSSIALSGAGAAGLSIAGAVITGTPTTAGAVNIIETLAGATGSPRTSSGVVTVAAATAPTITFPAVQAKRAAGQRSVIAMVGDSVTAGWGSGVATGTGAGSNPGTGGNYSRANGHPKQLAALLNAAGILTRADAYFSGVQSGNTVADVTTANPNVTFGTGWVMSTSTSLGGLIANAPATITTAMTFTPEYAADRFDVLVTGFSGLGTLTVTDASGVLATIDESITTGDVTASGGSAFRRITVSRATASTAPISIQRVSGGQIFVVGIIPYDTTAPRVELLNMGWPGSRAYGTGSGTAHWNAWTSGQSAWSNYYALGAINADAWTIELGANDTFGAISAANFQTAITNIASKVKTQGGDVALIKCHTATESGFNLSAAYLSAIDSVTSSLSLRPVIDFNSLALVTADRFDSIHLSQTGYGKEAAVEKTYYTGVA